MGPGFLPVCSLSVVTANALAPCVAESPEAMVLTMQAWYALVIQEEGVPQGVLF